MLWQIVLASIIGCLLWKILTGEEQYADVPGPKRWPLIGSPMEFMGKSSSEIFEMVTNKYPKIYGNRIMTKVFKRHILRIYDADDIEIILSHTKNIKKNKPYLFLQPWLGTGLLSSTGRKWHTRRKVLSPTFHFDILKNFMNVFEDHSQGLVKALKTQVQKGSNVVDLMPFVSDFTLYTICETAMGTKLNEGESNSKIKYKQAVLDIGQLVVERFTTLYQHSDAIYKLLPSGKQFNKNLHDVRVFADKLIMDRRNKVADKEYVPVDEQFSEKRRLALLDLLLESEKRGEIDLDGIKEEVNTFMFEGHDTTAIAITFGLMLLADHEEIQERLFDECVSVLGNSSRPATAADFSVMKYLDAVVKEMLRLYPSVPFIGREVVEDFKLGDIDVKAGVEIFINIFALHRQAKIYTEPEAFIPERFLSGESRHPYAYVPFSAGLRNCIGQRFAKLEIKSFLTEVIRNFKLEAVQKGVRPRLKADMVLRSDEPIYVKFHQRN